LLLLKLLHLDTDLVKEYTSLVGYSLVQYKIYLDCLQKSIPYTRFNISNGIALLALCEVACGSTNNLVQSSHKASKLPNNKHSTFGMGRMWPSKEVKIGEAMAQIGPFKEKKMKQCCGSFNEIIVYNVNQVRIKYLFKVKVQ
jgi:hypothetical protein